MAFMADAYSPTRKSYPNGFIEDLEIAEDFSEVFRHELDLKKEKEMFGHTDYTNRHRLTVIIIDKDNKEEYINYLKAVKKICEAFGAEGATLFASLIKLYDLKTLENDICTLCTMMLGELSLSLEQIRDAIEKIETSIADKIILDGSSYFFIYKMLKNLFCNFSSIIACMMRKKYFNDEGLLEVQERLVFLMSPEVEALRKAFKVVEGNNSLSETPIIN